MIRFVDLRGRLDEHRFAFWDTVADRFCTFGDEHAWNTRAEFEEAFAVPGQSPHTDITRFTDKLPEWADAPPAPEIDRLREALRDEAARLEAWARESLQGGWSTHQVGPMRKRADELRRLADGAAVSVTGSAGTP